MLSNKVMGLYHVFLSHRVVLKLGLVHIIGQYLKMQCLVEKRNYGHSAYVV